MRHIKNFQIAVPTEMVLKYIDMLYKKVSVGLSLLLLILWQNLKAQQSENFVKGRVTVEADSNSTLPFGGVKVYWLETQVGVYTDEKGEFSLERSNKTEKLVFSYAGYQSDTLATKGQHIIYVSLQQDMTLGEVQITSRKKTTEISYTDPLKTENISEQELLKAACCNLSESFETNPSVDVSFTDAITGTRQIQMLGLSGPYTYVTQENMPDVQGLSAMYGLTFTPGTWIESMQLIKGTGSVVNGFESIAGQINVELRKPETADRLYLNGYFNEGGRLELNANLAHRFLNQKWSTVLLLHGKNNSIKQDRNDDGFLDNPVDDHFIFLNRWKFTADNGIRFQAGVKGTYINSTSGQTDFQPDIDAKTRNSWGMALNLKRLEGWAKLGKVYQEKPWKSFGIQLSGARHEQDSYFGFNEYVATQNRLYVNTIYQGIIDNTQHNFKVGTSFQYDAYNERLNQTSFDRTEIVAGAYGEYTYTYLDRFTAVGGIRIDHHNLFGTFFTPRMHLRYAITDQSVIRVSVGRGQRTAQIFAENNGLLASSRQFVISGDDSNRPYGLDAEVAWSYGFNFTQNFLLDYREGFVSVDFYRTVFNNQIVIDLDQNPQEVLFYNLEGESYANSIQAQIDYEVLRRLDMRLAYRWLDVKTTYSGELLSNPLMSTHRAFVNFAYHTRNYWDFDLTINWQGAKRIPFTGSNPEAFQLSDRSPDFVIFNTQVSKKWFEKYELYLGVENLLNFVQSNPILSSEDPFSPYFDSSLIWGPVFGRNTYIGFRYRIK